MPSSEKGGNQVSPSSVPVSKLRALKSYLRTFDKEGDGTISRADLARALSPMSLGGSDRLYDACKNQDGRLQHDVFAHWIMGLGAPSSISYHGGRQIILATGPTAVGKDTVCEQLARKYGLPVVAPNNMLRKIKAGVEPDTDVLRDLVQRGARTKKVATDADRVALIIEQAHRDACAHGFIIVSWPKTLEQAQLVDAALARLGDKVRIILNLTVPNVDILKRRILGRWVHPASERVYHVDSRPPKRDEKTGMFIDEITGEPLIQRSDDLKGAEELDKKYASWQKDIGAMIRHYESQPDVEVRDVNANQQPAAVLAEADAFLSGLFAHG